MIILKSVLVWLVFILVESLNGTARIFWLIPLLGGSLAHRISFMIGSLLILAISTLFIQWLQAEKFIYLLSIGLVCLLLTVMVEIGLRRFVFSYSWEQIAADYFATGRINAHWLITAIAVPIYRSKNSRHFARDKCNQLT